MVHPEKAMLPTLLAVAIASGNVANAAPSKANKTVVDNCARLALGSNPANTFNIAPLDGADRGAIAEFSARAVSAACRESSIRSRTTSAVIMGQNDRGGWERLNEEPIRYSKLNGFFSSSPVDLIRTVDDQNENLKARVTTVVKLHEGGMRRSCGEITFFAAKSGQEPIVSSCRKQ